MFKFPLRLFGVAALFGLALLVPLGVMGTLASPKAMEALTLLRLTPQGATGLSIVASVFGAIVMMRKPPDDVSRLEQLGFLALCSTGAALVLAYLAYLITLINT